MYWFFAQNKNRKKEVTPPEPQYMGVSLYIVPRFCNSEPLHVHACYQYITEYRFTVTFTNTQDPSYQSMTAHYDYIVDSHDICHFDAGTVETLPGDTYTNTMNVPRESTLTKVEFKLSEYKWGSIDNMENVNTGGLPLRLAATIGYRAANGNDMPDIQNFDQNVYMNQYYTLGDFDMPLTDSSDVCVSQINIDHTLYRTFDR